MWRLFLKDPPNILAGANASACMVKSHSDAKNSEPNISFRIGEFRTSARFRMRGRSFARERVRNAANQDGLRTNGHESGGRTAGFRFAFKQELLQDFGGSPACGADLGWEFRRGGSASFGIHHSCCDAASCERVDP